MKIDTWEENQASNLSSHDILKYFNTRFYQVTYSDLLRRAPNYSGDLLLIHLSKFTPNYSEYLQKTRLCHHSQFCG